MTQEGWHVVKPQHSQSIFINSVDWAIKLQPNPTQLSLFSKKNEKNIIHLSLIQEGQLSVSGERMYTILVNRLED